MDAPPPPEGLRAAGARLWSEIASVLALDAHEERLLIEACRVADRLDALAVMVDAGQVMLSDGSINPALVEARQQQITLARLVASLRLPNDLEHPEQRPQRRGSARGAYVKALG